MVGSRSSRSSLPARPRVSRPNAARFTVVKNALSFAVLDLAVQADYPRRRPSSWHLSGDYRQSRLSILGKIGQAAAFLADRQAPSRNDRHIRTIRPETGLESAVGRTPGPSLVRRRTDSPSHGPLSRQASAPGPGPAGLPSPRVSLGSRRLARRFSRWIAS